MQNYKKYKDFIPLSFFYNKTKKTEKADKKYIIVLFMINLIMLPLSINNINSIIKKDSKTTEAKEEHYEGYKTSEINSWIDCIKYNEIKEASISQEQSYIKIDSLDTFYNSPLKDKLEITYVNNEEDICIAGVEKHE